MEMARVVETGKGVSWGDRDTKKGEKTYLQ